MEEATEEETPNVPVQSVQEQSVNPTVESVTETPIVAQEVEAEKKIVVEVKKGEEVLKEVDASDNSFIITPDYIQQSKLAPNVQGFWLHEKFNCNLNIPPYDL